MCVWGVRGQPGPHGAREKITVIFLHTQIAGKFFVMNQSLSFSLSPPPPLSPSLSYVLFIISPAIYCISTLLVLSYLHFFSFFSIYCHIFVNIRTSSVKVSFPPSLLTKIVHRGACPPHRPPIFCLCIICTYSFRPRPCLHKLTSRKVSLHDYWIFYKTAFKISQIKYCLLCELERIL